MYALTLCDIRRIGTLAELVALLGLSDVEATIPSVSEYRLLVPD